jgi:hypothetical protein
MNEWKSGIIKRKQERKDPKKEPKLGGKQKVDEKNPKISTFISFPTTIGCYHFSYSIGYKVFILFYFI